MIFSISLLKHPKASYHLQVPTTLIKHNLVPKLCWVHQGTQMAFVLAHGEQTPFLAQVLFLGFLSKFESINELSFGVLPMG